MASILTYEGLKYEKGSALKVADPLTVERALQININGSAYTVLIQTPDCEEELITGLLYAEDIIRKDTPHKIELVKQKDGTIQEANVTIEPEHLGKGYMSSRSLLSVSSCGICGKLELGDLNVSGERIKNEDQVRLEMIFEMQRTMLDNQVDYKATGGSHAAAAFDKFGNFLVLREDIGRHNAVDKVIGNLIRSKSLDQARFLAFSGRLSYEIVSKCFRAKIPLIIAVSAPSSLAIDFAKEYGMTLLAFTRNNKATCYANAWRIID